MSGVRINNAFDCFKDGAGVTMAFESWHFLFVLLLSVRNNIELFLLKKPLISRSNYLFDQTKGAVNESHLVV